MDGTSLDLLQWLHCKSHGGRVSMRAAIGLFAALAVFGGIASAESPAVETAGLFTPLPTVSTGSLLWKAGTVKVKCSCGKTQTTLQADYCPDGVKPSCDCTATPPAVLCPKARN
jgi:hypothetical protein